jgi:hypothetical protein
MKIVDIEECGPSSFLGFFSLLWETRFQISQCGCLGNPGFLKNITQVLVLIVKEDDANYDVNTFYFTVKRAVIKKRGV